jgi:hypothetical protein
LAFFSISFKQQTTLLLSPFPGKYDYSTECTSNKEKERKKERKNLRKK